MLLIRGKIKLNNNNNYAKLACSTHKHGARQAKEVTQDSKVTLIYGIFSVVAIGMDNKILHFSSADLICCFNTWVVFV